MSTEIEVLIVGFNSEDVVGEAIRSCRRIPNVSIAVIDHGADPTTLEAARICAAVVGLSFRGIHNPANPGFGAGCNHLAATSTAEWLLFLNPDAIIDAWGTDVLRPGWIVGARQFFPDGRRIHSAGRRYRVRDEMFRSWLRRMPPEPAGSGYVGAGALAIERSVFRELRGFDERYFLFYEDIDLCLRANRSKIGCIVDPSVEVTHALGHATRKDWTATLIRSYSSGRRFHNLHYQERRRYDLYVFIDSLFRSLATAGSAKSRAYRVLARRSLGNVLRGERSPSLASQYRSNGPTQDS